jgi:hypothetical protein
MAHRSMVRRSSATGRESTTCSCFDGYLFLFRRSPRQAGTVTSKTMWTMKKPKPCGLEGLDPDDPAVIAAIDLVRWNSRSALEPPHPPDRVQGTAWMSK